MHKSFMVNPHNGILANYKQFCVNVPEHADVEKFIYLHRKVIYINIAAHPGAKIIKLVMK